MNYRIIINKKEWLLLLSLIAIVALCIRYNFLPEKFFYDSMRLIEIERMVIDNNSFEYGSFGSAAKFFFYINIFKIDTLIGWSIYITIILSIVNFLLLKNISNIKLINLIFILVILFLQYLFVAGITKEVLQSIFYIVIYIFIYNNTIFKSTLSKIIAGVAVLIISSVLFRDYYILVSFFSITTYIINEFIKRKNINGLKSLLISISYSIVVLYIFLLLSSFLFLNQYEAIINLRGIHYVKLLKASTDSFIGNIIDGNNMFAYLINYIINYFRLLVPIELFFKIKMYYIPYVIYQITWTIYYIKNMCNLSNIDENKYMSLVFLTSFILVSVMMEPDFGSWIRHQCSCYMFMITLLKS